MSAGPAEELVEDPRTSSIVVLVPPSSTVDVPLGKLMTSSLLEICPPGYLPKCVQKHCIYSPSYAETSALPPYPAGSRLRFHFRATITHSGALLDDTRHGMRPIPMELITGKKFILEFWEVALNTMKENEVVRYIVPKEMCLYYPAVAKIKRDLTTARRRDHLIFTNYHSLQESLITGIGTGHPDLDDLLTVPQSLTFDLELMEVSLPGEYNIAVLHTDPFQSLIIPFEEPDNNESVISVERNADKFLVSRDYQRAATKYVEALTKFNEELQLSPPSAETEEQKTKRIALLMKAAYCKLNSKDYKESLELLTSVLEINADNPVALFRRGRCYLQTGHYDRARRDFARTLELDPTYQKAVKPELAIIDMEERRLNRN